MESGAKVKAALMVLPDQAAKDLEPEWFAEDENIRVADAFLVDVLLNACGETYDTLKDLPLRLKKILGRTNPKAPKNDAKNRVDRNN
jgi:hypothetical protein